MAARILGPILLTKFLRRRKRNRRAVPEEEHQQVLQNHPADETIGQ